MKRNSFLSLIRKGKRGTETCSSSCRCSQFLCDWPEVSLPELLLLMPSSSQWELPVANWKQNWSLSWQWPRRVSDMFGHSWNAKIEADPIWRRSRRGVQKLCMAQVLASAKLLCSKKCSLAQGWERLWALDPYSNAWRVEIKPRRHMH